MASPAPQRSWSSPTGRRAPTSWRPISPPSWSTTRLRGGCCSPTPRSLPAASPRSSTAWSAGWSAARSSARRPAAWWSPGTWTRRSRLRTSSRPSTFSWWPRTPSTSWTRSATPGPSSWGPTPPCRSATTSPDRTTRFRPLAPVGSLGDRAGIVRFASAYAPLDESLSRVVIDLGRRPYLSYNVPLKGRIGTLESEVIEEFWRALVIHLGATLHIDLIRGRNRHHIAESTFKALGLALRQAMAASGPTGVPSSKRLLG